MARRGRAVVEPAVSLHRRESGRATQELIALLRGRRRVLEQVRAPRGLLNPDTLDAANDLEEEQLWLAVAERREEINGQIDEAVRLLSEGRYGRCVDCQMVISPARLRALPFAIRCLACQERLERRNRPMASWPSFA
jgi:RNA polymerase-binding transcription factor DksA